LDLTGLDYIQYSEFTSMDERRRAAVDHHQVKVLKALAHPGRLRILFILRKSEACVCALTTWLSERQPYVSQQLGCLREAGLVGTHKTGKIVYYYVSDPRVFQFLDLLNDLASRRQHIPQHGVPLSANCKRSRCNLLTRRDPKGQTPGRQTGYQR
jgi:ArsR family transcriptional regulator